METIKCFHFRYGTSIIHRMDPRIKIPLFLLLQCGAASSTSSGLLLGFITLLVLALITQTGWLIYFLPRRPLLMLYTLSFVFAYTNGGSLYTVAIYCLGLQLMLGFAMLYLHTTRMHDIRESIQFYLHPLPKRWSASLGLAISILLLLIPILADLIQERKLAIKNRHGKKRFNLFFTLTTLRLEIISIIALGFDIIFDLEVSLKNRNLQYASKSKGLFFPVQTNINFFPIDILIIVLTLSPLTLGLLLKI